MLSSDYDKLDSQERANLRAFWESQATYLEQISQDNDVPILEGYCWDNDHQGGWSCLDCWNEMSEQEQQTWAKKKKR